MMMMSFLLVVLLVCRAAVAQEIYPRLNRYTAWDNLSSNFRNAAEGLDFSESTWNGAALLNPIEKDAYVTIQEEKPSSFVHVQNLQLNEDTCTFGSLHFESNLRDCEP